MWFRDCAGDCVVYGISACVDDHSFTLIVIISTIVDLTRKEFRHFVENKLNSVEQQPRGAATGTREINRVWMIV